MRTLSVSPIRTDGPDDVDNVVVDGIEALRQRIQQRLRFPLGTWDLDTRRGTESTLGHNMTPALAASALTDAILDEGGDEITGAPEVRSVLDHDTRALSYSATIPTIYGDMVVTAPAF